MEKRYTKKKSKRIKWIFCSLLLIASIYGVFTLMKIKHAVEQSSVDLGRDGGKSEFREEDIVLSKDPISILLLGIEDYSTQSANGRADTQIVMTLDPSTKEIHMLTIPRDTRVFIDNAGEYSGTRKINAAYTYGDITGYGASKLQMETVESLLNIPIDHFVAVKFDGFRDIVDTLGGISIDIKEAFSEENFYTNEIIAFQQGQTRLTGEEALAFVRMRKQAVNANYSRDERQRQFLEATIDQALSAGTIFKIGDIAEILGDNIQTDLTVKEIYALQQQFTSSTNVTITTIDLAGSDQIINRVSFFVPDETGLASVSQQLRSILKLASLDEL